MHRYLDTHSYALHCIRVAVSHLHIYLEYIYTFLLTDGLMHTMIRYDDIVGMVLHHMCIALTKDTPMSLGIPSKSSPLQSRYSDLICLGTLAFNSDICANRPDFLKSLYNY